MSPLSPPPPPPPLPGLLHTYSLTPHLTAFQHPPLSPTGVILFVPGLGDTLSSVQYTTSLAKALEDSGKGWCLVQVGLSSAGGGWGTGTVRRDAEELRECVSYWREEREVDKIVVMGHSTGCQDAIAYTLLSLTSPSSFPSLTGIILQAPVSDREYFPTLTPSTPLPPLPSPSEAKPPQAELLPRAFGQIWGLQGGISRERWCSLVEKPVSDEVDVDQSEDFFSSDLNNERLRNVFRGLGSSLLVLMSGEDEAYPEEVKKALERLLKRFEEAVGEERWSKKSRILKGASHAIKEEGPRKEMIETVLKFIDGL